MNWYKKGDTFAGGVGDIFSGGRMRRRVGSGGEARAGRTYPSCRR